MTTLPNRTRTSPSIPRRLLREGKVHLLPLYALMRTSDLGREGIENSGSYRFSDHVYRNEPSGRFVIGHLVDALLLRMRAARSMRSRFRHVRSAIVGAARERLRSTRTLRVLSVPCGIARDLAETSLFVRHELPDVGRRISWFGIDLDPEPLALSRQLSGTHDGFQFIEGDAFDPGIYPPALDLIASIGFGEFLPDEQLVRFYGICRAALAEGGAFVTSGMQPDRLADYLMRELAELRTHYRTAPQLEALLRAAGFTDIVARPDEAGLQTLIVARTGPRSPA